MYIAASAPGSDFPPEFGVAAEFFVQYKEQSQLLEDVSTYNSFTATLRTAERVERIRMSQPTYSLFSTLGAHPMLGRLPVEGDESRVVVISYALWTSWFGGDSSVIGRSYRHCRRHSHDHRRHGAGLPLPGRRTMLWISSVIRPEGIRRPGRFGQRLVARMKPGVTPAAWPAN